MLTSDLLLEQRLAQADVVDAETRLTIARARLAAATAAIDREYA